MVRVGVRHYARPESISKRSFSRGLPQERDPAQRAPSARAGIPDLFHECAQTFSAARAESAMFVGDFKTYDGSKTRRLRQCKMSIREVLISVTLNARGEVAEWPKAAVC